MKKQVRILIGILAALAALWLIAFVYQEASNASLYLFVKPQIQGLIRLRPVKSEHIAYPDPEGVPCIYFEYFADEKGYGLPVGWQPPGTVELVMKEDGWAATMRFDEPPYAGNYVRIAKVTRPDLLRVTCKAYFLGVFPLRGMRDGYCIYSHENQSAWVKVYCEEVSVDNLLAPVMTVSDTEIIQLHYIHPHAPEWLIQDIVEGRAPTRWGIIPLTPWTAYEVMLHYPTKIFFP